MPDNLIIPSCPEILLELNAEIMKEEPDIQAISDLINKDVGLFGSLLATVNSPALGLKQTVESIPQAIMLLGPRRTFTLLQSVIMRNSLQEIRLDRFWDTATEVAGLCSYLAIRLTTVNQNHAYSMGMLHDIGIPIMMANFANYKEFLRDVGNVDLRELSTREVEHFQVDHFTLGYRLTKDWHLPTAVSKIILLQPLFEKAFNHSIKVHDNLLNYLAILILAKDISSEYRHFWRINQEEHTAEHLLPIFEFLEITQHEYQEIKTKLIEQIQDQQRD